MPNDVDIDVDVAAAAPPARVTVADARRAEPRDGTELIIKVK